MSTYNNHSDPMAEAAAEIQGELLRGVPWWYPPVITILWIVALSLAVIAPVLVIAAWRFLI